MLASTSARICASSSSRAASRQRQTRSLYALASAHGAATSSHARSQRLSLQSYAQRPQAQQQPQARRPFSHTPTARAFASAQPPAELSQLVSHPTPESLRAQLTEADEDEDADVELVPLEEAQLQLTERAAEQLRKIAERERDGEAALRIAVESGGCHGYQYKMELANDRRADDYVFSHPKVKPSNVVVDAVSMGLLKGSVIDFATELIGSSFRVVENPQAKGSGCGCGVSWELKD
ncbi:hypothetical protein BDW22DRAFT_1373425 [Trametopsis cervina]|nr:hypothetical protein BDW22DRAFT_1373425 [Trametopsis cervina]